MNLDSQQLGDGILVTYPIYFTHETVCEEEKKEDIEDKK